MKVSFEIPKENEELFKKALEVHNALKDHSKILHIEVSTRFHFIPDLYINIKDFNVEE